jgi:hypothetical protein
MHTTPISPQVCRRCGCWAGPRPMVLGFTHLMGSRPVAMHEDCAATWRPMGLSYIVRPNVMDRWNVIVRRNGRTTHVVSYGRRRDAVRGILRGACQRDELRYGLQS